MGIKKMAVIVLAVTLAIISGGCSKMDDNKMKNTAEEALAEKYGEAFTAIETEAIDKDSSYVWLRPEKIPSAVVKSAINEDGTGLLDNYITVKLCHEVSEKAEWNLREYPGGYYVHTDNSMEYTYADDKDITASEYVKKNPADYFVVSVILNSQNADYEILYGELVRLTSELDLNSGYLDVYELGNDDFTEIQNIISRYDKMNSSEVKYMLDDAGGPKISLDLSKVYTSAEEIKRGAKDE